MPIYRNDDDIHRYQPLFIEMRGWQLPVQARYVTWIVWFVATVAAYVLITVRLTGPLQGALWAAAIGGGISYLTADHITNEIGLTAWIQTGTAEARAWRTSRARQERLTAPVARYATARITTAAEHTQPTWNPIRWIHPRSAR